MEQELDDVIHPGVDCSYSLWNEHQGHYVPAQPVRYYHLSLRKETMIIGLLNLKEKQLVFSPIGRDYIGQEPTVLELGATFEIGLAGIWIPVELRAEYGDSDEIMNLRFVTSDSTFCGFFPGMKARLTQ